MSLGLALSAVAAARPDAPCLWGAGEARAATWAEVWRRVGVIAERLAALRGQVVVLALPDGPDLAIALAACWVAGAIAFPIPATATPFERERLLAGLAGAPVLAGLPERELSPSSDAHRDPTGTVALLVATSGSTGLPRLVALRADGMAWNATAHADSLGLPAGVLTLATTGLSHAFSLVAVLLASWLRGGALVWGKGPFTPGAFSRTVSTAGIGYAAMPPPLLRLLVGRASADAALPPILSVGAAAVPAAELREAIAWAEARHSRLFHTYGLSEAGPRVSTLAPEDASAHAESVGKALAGIEVRVRDGVLALRSPGVMAGYWPALGADAGDWLDTGDIAAIDDEGFITLFGRSKDLIVCGGVNVTPGELEDALRADPRVADAAVVGRPSDDYGEVPWAYVVLAAPATPGELLAALATRLSRPKLPHGIVTVPELPRTALGKVNKQQLKEAECAGSS